MDYDRKDLKIQALLEKVSELTTNYENKIADLRVEITVKDQDLKNSQTQIESLRVALEQKEAEVEVVSEAAETDSAD